MTTIEGAGPPRRWVKRPGVVFRRVGGSLVVGEPDSREVLVVAPPAALIWDLLGRSCTSDELVDRLCEHTDGDRTTIASDLGPLLAKWCSHGWLDRC